MSAHPRDFPARNYFGEKWDAPAFEDAVEVPVPVGQDCFLCSEPVVEGDSGTMEWYMAPEAASYRPVHIECFLRMILGSPAHLRGMCSCTSGDHVDDDDGRSWREQARATMQILREERS